MGIQQIFLDLTAPMCEKTAQVALMALLILMVLDVILGIAGAKSNDDISSSKMRKGGWHKIGELGLVMVADLLDGCMLAGVDLPYSAPICTTVIVYLVITEAISCMENCCALNPDLEGSPAFKVLRAVTVTDEDEQ